MLDGTAVEVAGGEIHFGESARRAQPGVDQADALEQLGPVDIRDQTHAGDDVAHADVGGALALLCMQHHVFHRAALLHQALLQPAEGRHGARVLVAQALGQLGGEQLR